MKTKRILIIVVIVIGVIISFLFFILQHKSNVPLKEELTQKRRQREEIERSANYLEELEAKSMQLDKEEEVLYEAIPKEEGETLTLIRELISLSNEIGLDKVNFTTQPAAELNLQKSSKEEFRSSTIYMNFEADFQQLIKFLERISKLKRLVFPGKIDVERLEEILPHQKVRLQLITYSF